MQIDPVDFKNNFRINVGLQTKKVLLVNLLDFLSRKKNVEV